MTARADMFSEVAAQPGGKVAGTDANDGMELRVVLGGRDLSSRLADIEETGRRAITEADVRIISSRCAEEALRTRDAEMQGLRQHAEDHAAELQQLAAGVAQRFAACEKRIDNERAEHRRSLGELALKLHGLEVLASRLADTVASVLQEPEVRRVVESCVAEALVSRDALVEDIQQQTSAHSQSLKDHSSRMQEECTARHRDFMEVSSKVSAEADERARIKDDLTRLSDRIGVVIAKSDLLEASVGKAQSELASKVSNAADGQAKLKDEIYQARDKIAACVAKNDLLEVSLGKTSTEFRSAHSSLEAQVGEKTGRMSDDLLRVQGRAADLEKATAELRAAISNNAPLERLADDVSRLEATSAAALKSAIATEAGRREAGLQAAEGKIGNALNVTTGVRDDVARLAERAEAGASRSDHLAASVDAVKAELQSVLAALKRQMEEQCGALRETWRACEVQRAGELGEYATLSRLAEDLAQAEARALAAAAGAMASDTEVDTKVASALAAAGVAEAAAAATAEALGAQLEAERSARGEDVARLRELAAAAERRQEGRCEALEVQSADKLKQAQDAWEQHARANDLAMNALRDNLQELEYGLGNHTHDLQFPETVKQSLVPSRPPGPSPKSAGGGASAARTLSSTFSSTPRGHTTPLELHA